MKRTVDEMPKTAEEIRAKLRRSWFDKAKKVPFVIQHLQALALSDLALADKGAGMILALFANKQGKCYPKQATIMALARENERSIRYRTRRLEKAGFVTAETGCGNVSTHYHLRIPQQTLDELAVLMEGTEGHSHAPLEGHSGAPQRGTTVPPNYLIELPQRNYLEEREEGAELFPQSHEGGLEGARDFSPAPPANTAAPDFSENSRMKSLDRKRELASSALQEEIEDFREMALRAKKLDRNSMLAPQMFKRAAYVQLGELCSRIGVRFVEEAIDFVLAHSLTDGEMRRKGVRSWKYFEMKALEYRKIYDIAEAGCAPGDLFGIKVEVSCDRG